MAESASIGIGFALVLLSGLCAPLGACVVCFLTRQNKQVLAGCIALAAGVMVFVSLTEVMSNSIDDLKEAGLSLVLAHTIAYLGFFGGVLVCGALDLVTDNALKWAARRNISCSSSSLAKQPPSPAAISKGGAAAVAPLSLVSLSGCEAAAAAADAGDQSTTTRSSSDDMIVDVEMQELKDAAGAMLACDDDMQLARTSLLIGLALAFHNLPEGLATFVGYMSSPHLGVTIAIAIAVHNIPEGVAVGVPVYYATGSKMKAIFWAAVSGMAEPLGAVIGLAVQLSGHLSLVAMGIIMALVSGIMTGVAFRELVPRALQYDPGNRFATHGVFAGMAIMAMSLVLLGLWDPAAQ